MPKNQTKVRVQQAKNKQFKITLPEIIAKQWLDVKKGDRIGFEHFKGIIRIFKVE